MGFDPMCVTTNRVLKKLGGGIGNTIAPGVLTYDGNEEGKEVVVVGSNRLVKLLDRPVAETEIESVTVLGDGFTITGKKADFQVERVNDDLFGIILFTDTGLQFGSIFSASKESDLGGGIVLGEGTYSACAPGASVEIHGVLMPAETIHPIDPKFLPGVCLPVVELSITPTDSWTELTEEQGNALDAVAETGLPVLINLTLLGTYMSAVFSNNLAQDGVRVLMYSFGTNIMQFRTSESGWVFTQPM